MSIRDVDSEAFTAEVLDSSAPVLVEFWAGWCSGCVTFEPTLQKFESTYGEKLRVVKINVDENRELADSYGVKAMPVLKVIQNGEVQKTMQGAVPLYEMESDLADYI